MDRMGVQAAASALFASVLIAAGCASNPAGDSDSATFDRARLIAALRTANATVAEGGEVEQPFFSVPGRILVVDGEDVQAFEYSSPSAAAAEAARIAPDGSSAGTVSMAWVAPPHFFRRERVIALYVGSNERILGVLGTVFGSQFAGR